MRRDDPTRLRHMLDAARLAVSFSSAHDRSELDGNAFAVLGLVKAVEIVGEAAGRVSADFKGKHPEIPWDDAVSMRNRLVHAYFDIDLDILWETVTVDLPALVADLEAALPPEAS